MSSDHLLLSGEFQTLKSKTRLDKTTVESLEAFANHDFFMQSLQIPCDGNKAANESMNALIMSKVNVSISQIDVGKQIKELKFNWNPRQDGPDKRACRQVLETS
jgi:hypothetical protein